MARIQYNTAIRYFLDSNPQLDGTTDENIEVDTGCSTYSDGENID